MVKRVRARMKKTPHSRIGRLLPLMAFLPFEATVPGTALASYPIANAIASKLRLSKTPLGRGIFKGLKPARVLGSTLKRKIKKAFGM